ncbi:MAG: GAF domain-containing protein, partial [Desulfobacterales bacterium]
LRGLVRGRWWIPPAILAGILGGRLAGSDLPAEKLLLVAAYILAYNLGFYRWSLDFAREAARYGPARRRFAFWQAALDSSALFLLTAFSGGLASPIRFFFIGHAVLIAFLLPSRSTYGLIVLMVAGLIGLAASEYMGWIPPHALGSAARSLETSRAASQLFTEILFLATALFLSAFLTASGKKLFRQNIDSLRQRCDALTGTNKKFKTLFSMIHALGSAQHLDQVLQTVTTEFTAALEVKGVSVKLLSDEGKSLRYAAACGLPEAFIKEKVVEVDKSPLNKRIIEGEPFVTGNVTASEMFQFGEVLTEAEIRSVLFLPLNLDGRIIGILGAYCERPNRFHQEDVDFLRLAAGIVAIALENARAYEAVEKALRERSWFMMRVAHNLRAPLAAMLSILEVVCGGYLGQLNDEQREYLRRLDRRVRTMLSLISELMFLARNREEKLSAAQAATDPTLLARRIRRTFQDKAAEKRVNFMVDAPEDLPPLRGQLEVIEQMLENLISNAIKYTPTEGSVNVRFSQTNGKIRFEISDTGIGIPAADKAKLFTEFFRAENAKSVAKDGTGLGLAIVKEIVDNLDGRILAESEEGVGTVFVVDLPTAAAPEKTAATTGPSDPTQNAMEGLTRHK